jgi:hypothetical protein
MDHGFNELAVIHRAHARNEAQQSRRRWIGTCYGDRYTRREWSAGLDAGYTDPGREALFAVHHAGDRAGALRTQSLAAVLAESSHWKIGMIDAVHAMPLSA